jgi:hypothetical protein
MTIFIRLMAPRRFLPQVAIEATSHLMPMQADPSRQANQVGSSIIVLGSNYGFIIVLGIE